MSFVYFYVNWIMLHFTTLIYNHLQTYEGFVFSQNQYYQKKCSHKHMCIVTKHTHRMITRHSMNRVIINNRRIPSLPFWGIQTYRVVSLQGVLLHLLKITSMGLQYRKLYITTFTHYVCNLQYFVSPHEKWQRTYYWAWASCYESFSRKVMKRCTMMHFSIYKITVWV